MLGSSSTFQTELAVTNMRIFAFRYKLLVAAYRWMTTGKPINLIMTTMCVKIEN